MSTKESRQQLLKDIETAEADTMRSMSHKYKFVALLIAAIADKVKEGDEYVGDEGKFLVRHISFCDGSPGGYSALVRTPRLRLWGPAVRVDGTRGVRTRDTYVDIHGNMLDRKTGKPMELVP